MGREVRFWPKATGCDVTCWKRLRSVVVAVLTMIEIELSVCRFMLPVAEKIIW
jgi:hypothetical protein